MQEYSQEHIDSMLKPFKDTFELKLKQKQEHFLKLKDSLKEDIKRNRAIKDNNKKKI